MGALTSLSRTETSFWLGVSEYTLLAFALVVVIGLIGEHKLPWWHVRYGLFEFLVLAGCAGELFADGGVFFFSRRLETLSDLEIARVYSRLGPRHLMQDQQKRIADKLSKYSGLPVDVYVMPEEDRATMDEALTLGKDISGALLPFMDVNGRAGITCQPWALIGVLVSAPQDLSRDRYAAGDILAALTSEGIDVVPFVPEHTIPPCSMFGGLSTKPDKRTGLAKISIIVGKRPTPILK